MLGFLTETIVTALNAHFGTDIIVSEMTNYWIEDDLPSDQAKWITEQFERSSLYENVAPDYSAIAALNAMHRGGYDVIVSSDRPAHTKPGTIDWLKKWRVEHDEVVLRGRGSKLSIAREHGPGDPLILFDDDPRKATFFPSPGVELWMPQRPWTPPDVDKYEGVWVFERWADVLDRLGLPTAVPIPQFSRDAGPALDAQGKPQPGSLP